LKATIVSKLYLLLLIFSKSTYLPLIIIIAILLCGIIACKPFDYKAEIPSYIEINEIIHNTDSLEGAPHHNITDVWVYIDDNAIGAYELPAKFPVLYDGTHEIKIRAGIKKDGFTTIRDEYQFYGFYTTSEKLIRGNTFKITPEIKYFSGITFELVEDFEIGSVFQQTSTSDTGIILNSVDTLSFLENQSASIYLDNNHSYFEMATNEQYVLPRGFPVYLELSYKCDNEFSIGLVKNTIYGPEKINPYITLNQKLSWNKIYIDFTEYIKSHTDAISFELYFTANKNPNISIATISLDNIKLIHD